MIHSKLEALKQKNYQILLGVELEFYSALGKEVFMQEGVLIKSEIGEGQLEAVFEHDFNILQVLRKVIHFRNKFAGIANFNAFVFFSALVNDSLVTVFHSHLRHIEQAVSNFVVGFHFGTSKSRIFTKKMNPRIGVKYNEAFFIYLGQSFSFKVA